MMLAILISIALFGFILSICLRLGTCNPFTLFFGIWSAIFTTYWLFADVYEEVSPEYLFIQICIQAFALFFMVCVRPAHINTNLDAFESPYQLNQKMMTLVQLLLLLAMPVIYQKSVEFAGANIFTSYGYMRLRYAYNEAGMDIGPLRYVYFMSFVAAAVAVYFASLKQLGKWRAVLAVLTALCYAYLATGRTYFLMVFVFTVIPLVLAGKVSTRSLFALGGMLMGMFFLIALMTAKGASTDASFGDNIVSFVDSAQSYVIAPFVALSMLFEELKVQSMGDHSLRFVLSIFAALGMTDPPGSIVKGYKFTPAPTNLYTVYEVYFRDFGVIGFFVPLIFLPLHWLFYQLARKKNDFFVLMYAVSVYPLVSQILQDQYMTLISSWIQVFLVFLLLIQKKQTMKAY